MKHNPMIRFLGVWYLIETDKHGKMWAVSGDVRLPYGQGGLTQLDEVRAQAIPEKI